MESHTNLDGEHWWKAVYRWIMSSGKELWDLVPLGGYSCSTPRARFHGRRVAINTTPVSTRLGRYMCINKRLSVREFDIYCKIKPGMWQSKQIQVPFGSLAYRY
ncbi:hypothetical protein DID88_008459 [Monilinia fructigena]|uniref:Uncharacterized protein n=1 Tax=Monilinia fructigena TaxID=38457 RepID=A0A395J6I0_9HELO|nr:hypothetical protein DID88_008459 [Monilinia fructigena]